MVTRNMYRKIQESKKKGKLKSEISREMKLDPGTVAKYYDMSEGEYRGYERAHRYRGKEFDRYREDILEVYERNGYKRLPMSAVYDYLSYFPHLRNPISRHTIRRRHETRHTAAA